MNDIQRKELAALTAKFSNGEGIFETAVPGLKCIKLSHIDMRLPGVYNPSLCVIVQGSKRVLLEDEVYQYAPSQYLAVSVDLPIIGQVTMAEPNAPYLCLQIDIDPRVMSELMMQVRPDAAADTGTGRGIFVGQMDDALGDSVLRLARLLENPRDILPLAPMITREIYYRLLNGDHGPTIAQIALSGSNMHRIAGVISRIKNDYDKPLRVEDMADLAGMSVSSFHYHFKEVTAMSPLQYQKRLRLVEARRMMLSDQLDAASTAYRVGYESPSQFSREYSRMFGNPPGRDIESLRASA